MDTFDTALIIEDDPDVLRAARIVLAGHFAKLVTTTTADVDALLSPAMDVVLLDMNFAAGEHTGREGLDALSAIKAYDPTLSIVLMTAFGSVSLAVEALKQGATDFVLKPWRNDRLIAAVTAACELTRSRRSGNTLDLDAIERRAIEQALAQHQGNISSAATALGLSRPALYRRLSKHGLS